MAESGGLPSMGSHRVGHDWSDLAAAAANVCDISGKQFSQCATFFFLLTVIFDTDFFMLLRIGITRFFSFVFLFGEKEKFWLRWWRLCLQCRRPRFNPWVRRIPRLREWLHTPVFLPGASHGQRSLMGYSRWGCKVRHDWATNTFMSYWITFPFTNFT